MSLFGKKPDQHHPSSPAAPAPAPPRSPQPVSAPPPAATASGKGRSFLGSGCSLEGQLNGEGSFECGGTFDGTIDLSGDVVIGQGGVATAQLKARRISIEGRLCGNATGAEKVEVGASGHVEGDVRAPAVQFAEGAFFEGNVEMRRAEGSAASASAGSDGSGTAADSGGETGGSG